MAHYIPAALGATYLAKAGWPDTELITATAVMGAESSFQLDADNGIAAGLMGINYKAHPQYDRARLKEDGQYNCECALEIFQTQAPTNQWSNGKWATYPVAYKAYLQTAKSAVASYHKDGGATAADHDLSKTDPFSAAPKEGLDDKVADATDSVIGAFDSVPKFLGRLGEAIFSRDFWWRVFKILVGLGLTGVAIHMILQSTSVGRTLEGAAQKAALA